MRIGSHRNTLLKVLNNLADTKSAGGVALRLRTQGRQAAAGLDIVRTLAEANALQLCDPFLRSLIETGRHAHPAYLAHEFMNEAWRPTFHADVVLALRAAKLDSVPADLLENFSPLMLHDEARAVLDRFDEPPMRELVKDMCLDRALRQDVFVRGARRLSPLERDAALGELTLALGLSLRAVHLGT